MTSIGPYYQPFDVRFLYRTPAIIIKERNDAKQNHPSMIKDNSILGIINTDKNLSIFKQILERSNFYHLFINSKPQTLFVPTNHSLKNINVSDIVDDVGKCRNIVKYTICPGLLSRILMQYSPVFTLPTLHADTLNVQTTNHGTLVNGLVVQTWNRNASDGVIHEINGLLVPQM